MGKMLFIFVGKQCFNEISLIFKTKSNGYNIKPPFLSAGK